MTSPEQVVVTSYSECAPAAERPGWCEVHESRWAFKAYQHCDVMIDYIDLAEQAVEAYRADLRVAVENLEKVGMHTDADGDYICTVWFDEVLDLIDGGGSDE